MHIIDAHLSYMMGVVSRTCSSRWIWRTVRCQTTSSTRWSFARAGTTPMDPRGEEHSGRGGALWCTGILSLLDASNQPYIIYSPYTYAQLQNLAAGTDA